VIDCDLLNLAWSWEGVYSGSSHCLRCFCNVVMNWSISRSACQHLSNANQTHVDNTAHIQLELTLLQSVHSHHNLPDCLPSQHVLYGIYYRLDTGKLLFIHPCLQLALSMQIKQLLSVSWDVLPVSLHGTRDSH
jgi:hypothetical protein